MTRNLIYGRHLFWDDMDTPYLRWDFLSELVSNMGHGYMTSCGGIFIKAMLRFVILAEYGM